jgi:hypothetical protein
MVEFGGAERVDGGAVFEESDGRQAFGDLRATFEVLLEKELDKVQSTSTPGFPWMLIHKTNKGYKTQRVSRDLIKREVIGRIERIMSEPRLYSLTPVELVKRGLCDPIRLFIKNEPHGARKLKSGKLRLISGVSIVDQLIDRILFSCQNELEISMWKDIPSQPGIGFSDEQQRHIAAWIEKIQALGRRLAATDISGWDWSVQFWELWCELQMRLDLAGSRATAYELLCTARFYMAMWKLFILPDGELIAQTWAGIMASGLYITSSSNSRLRLFVRAVAYLLWCKRNGVEPDPKEVLRAKAMGDDCVEAELHGSVYETILAELGHDTKMTEYTSTLEGSEFCSHTWWKDGLARPVNYQKMLFRFANHATNSPLLVEMGVQLDYELRNMRGVGDSLIRQVFDVQLGTSNYGN